MRKRRKKRKSAYLFFLLPSFLGVTLFVLAPFADVVRRSFVTAVTGEFRGFENYKMVFETRAFRMAAGNTARFILRWKRIPFRWMERNISSRASGCGETGMTVLVRISGANGSGRKMIA